LDGGKKMNEKEESRTGLSNTDVITEGGGEII